MLSKKVAFKNVEEAQQAATKIVKEANQIRSFFRKIAAEGVNVDWPFEVISMLAEVSSYYYNPYVSLQTLSTNLTLHAVVSYVMNDQPTNRSWKT